MNIKEQIQSDYISAMKAGDITKKNALGMLKSTITNAEKVNGKELSEADLTKVIAKEVKSRQDNYQLYSDVGEITRAELELAEAITFKKYLPKELTVEELTKEIHSALSHMTNITNRNALEGKTLGEISKKFPGQFDRNVAMSIIKNILDSRVD